MPLARHGVELLALAGLLLVLHRAVPPAPSHTVSTGTVVDDSPCCDPVVEEAASMSSSPLEPTASGRRADTRTRTRTATEPTSEKWKEMSEKDKYDYIRRNYGDVEPRRTLETIAETKANLPRRPVGAKVGVQRVPQATEPTPEKWKELSEKEKYAFIHRNYGTTTRQTTSPPPSESGEASRAATHTSE